MQEVCFVFISLINLNELSSSWSSHIWLYCGALLLDKGPHVLRDW